MLVIAYPSCGGPYEPVFPAAGVAEICLATPVSTIGALAHKSCSTEY